MQKGIQRKGTWTMPQRITALKQVRAASIPAECTNNWWSKDWKIGITTGSLAGVHHWLDDTWRFQLLIIFESLVVWPYLSLTWFSKIASFCIVLHTWMGCSLYAALPSPVQCDFQPVCGLRLWNGRVCSILCVCVFPPNHPSHHWFGKADACKWALQPFFFAE